MKRIEMKLKDFCMRYPISETVCIEDKDTKQLIETEIYSRSMLHESFDKDSVISFNELTMKEETAYYDKVEKKEAKNNIFEMLDV